MASTTRSKATHVFVYGTLLRGERNHGRLERATYLGEVATAEGVELRDLGDYPGMVKAGSGCVQGELYLVDQETLADLDDLEGHPDLFWRTTIRLVDGRLVQAYLIRDRWVGGARTIAGGDWRQRA